MGSSISSTATVSSTATAARDFALRFAAPVPAGSLHGASTAEVEVARKSRQEATAAGALKRDDGSVSGGRRELKKVTVLMFYEG